MVHNRIVFRRKVRLSINKLIMNIEENIAGNRKTGNETIVPMSEEITGELGRDSVGLKRVRHFFDARMMSATNHAVEEIGEDEITKMWRDALGDYKKEKEVGVMASGTSITEPEWPTS